MTKPDEKEEKQGSFSTEKGNTFPGYPHYPANEDITKADNNNGKEELGDENTDEDISGGLELDIPGSGDDNPDEAIGEEDEENNYYSLGGDNHEAQEEDNGD